MLDITISILCSSNRAGDRPEIDSLAGEIKVRQKKKKRRKKKEERNYQASLEEMNDMARYSLGTSERRRRFPEDAKDRRPVLG